LSSCPYGFREYEVVLGSHQRAVKITTKDYLKMKTIIAIIVMIVMAETLFTEPARADFKLPSMFGDHMVLQRDIPVPIWGWARPSQPVRVHFEGQSVTGQADEAGKWMVYLEPLSVGGPYEMTIQVGEQQRTLSDVLVGEVWLCSGQSNMGMALRRTSGAEGEIAAADHPSLRLFQVGLAMSDEPLDDVQARWAVCTPDAVAGFSAAAYFFGRDLQKELGVPVGVIQCAYGGSPAEGWISQKALAAESDLAPVLVNDRAKKQRYEKDMAAYHEASSQGDTSVKEPKPLIGRHRPLVMYNAMLHPLIPYAVRGVTWYQGESNVNRAHQYPLVLTTMINDWRSRWGQPRMPFGIVQLPNYVSPSQQSKGRFDWPQLRESQHQVAQDLPDIGLVVTIDVGDPTDIHPLNKKDVGRRLALWALASVYGRDIVSSGPVFGEANFEGDKVRISFDHVGSGLASRAGEPIRGFVIAGADRRFRWATAKIVGDQIVVSDKYTPQPIAVRYAWDENPYWANLINTEGLPAAPFRTDDWSVILDRND
jgi:sialate O-acetylesterase